MKDLVVLSGSALLLKGDEGGRLTSLFLLPLDRPSLRRIVDELVTDTAPEFAAPPPPFFNEFTSENDFVLLSGESILKFHQRARL